MGLTGTTTRCAPVCVYWWWAWLWPLQLHSSSLEDKSSQASLAVFILTRVVLFRMDSSSLDLASNSLDLASNNNNFNLTRLVNHVESSDATQSLVSTGAPRPCSRSHLDSLKLVAHSSVSENKLSSHTL